MAYLIKDHTGGHYQVAILTFTFLITSSLINEINQMYVCFIFWFPQRKQGKGVYTITCRIQQTVGIGRRYHVSVVRLRTCTRTPARACMLFVQVKIVNRQTPPIDGMSLCALQISDYCTAPTVKDKINSMFFQTNNSSK